MLFFYRFKELPSFKEAIEGLFSFWWVDCKLDFLWYSICFIDYCYVLFWTNEKSNKHHIALLILYDKSMDLIRNVGENVCRNMSCVCFCSSFVRKITLRLLYINYEVSRLLINFLPCLKLFLWVSKWCVCVSSFAFFPRSSKFDWFC